MTMSSLAQSDGCDFDVAIVGAGPVGLTIANYLGMMGVSTLLLEQRDRLIDYPRGVGMDDECLRSFQAIGLAEMIASHTTPGQKMRFVSAKGKTFALIDPKTLEFGWPRRNSFIQPMVDEMLHGGLERFDCVSTEFSVELKSFEQDFDGVTIVTQRKGVEQIRRARWLVGCDGGRSIVRKSLGIDFDGITDSTRWVVIDIQDDPIGLPDSYLHCVPARPYVSIALPHGMRRLEFMVFGDETEQELCSDDGVQSLLGRVLPHPEKAKILRSRVYTHNARLAGSFGQGRAFLAGDAAHLMPVWQGQGYNSGIRDATNLAWKLAMVAQGFASNAILDTYDMERREHAKAMIDLSVTAGRIFAPTSRFVAGLRDRIALALNAIPPIKRYFVQMRFKPMPRFTRGVVWTGEKGKVRGQATGKLFPQPQVLTRAGEVKRLDDVIGLRFAVLSWGTDPHLHMTDEANAYWRGLGAVMIAVLPETQLQNFRGHIHPETVVLGDLSGAFHDWFAAQENDGSVVVIRPDRFVAAIAPPQLLEEASAALRAIIGEPSRNTTENRQTGALPMESAA